eukprot:scaffold646946_cov53-Prasinocladus_malaysianus.AAC.1
MVKSMADRGQEDFFRTIPCDVYRQIHGQTLWLVGDSQTLYWYKSLRCFMREFRADPGEFDTNVVTNQTTLNRIWDNILQHPKVPSKFASNVMPLCTNLIGEVLQRQQHACIQGY